MAQRKKLGPKGKLRLKERKRHRKYLKKVGDHVVFGKKVRSRMVRVSVKYADQLAKRARAAGLSLPEYTAKLVKRK